MPVHDRNGAAGDGRRLVICYGNPLCGDDGVGWHIGRCLEEKKLPAHILIVVCHQLTPDLAEPISQAEQVVFVDARLKGRPGEVTCTPLVSEGSPFSPIGHTMTPPTLLALSQWLYGKTPAALLYSVVGTRFKPGDALSPEVERVLPTLLPLVCRCLTTAVEKKECTLSRLAEGFR